MSGRAAGQPRVGSVADAMLGQNIYCSIFDTLQRVGGYVRRRRRPRFVPYDQLMLDCDDRVTKPSK